MKTQKRIKFLKIIGLSLTVLMLYARPMNAQTSTDDTQVDDVDPLHKDVADKSLSKDIKYLSLFIGIESQEHVEALPAGADFGGDFKKVTRVGLDRSTGTLRFTPTKVGVATLTIRQGTKILQEFRIDVKKSDLTKVAKDIQNLLKDIDGITIKIVNNHVVVDGQVLLPREINRIHSVLKQFEGQASSLVILSPVAERKIAQMIEADIGNPTVRVRSINGKFILEGEVTSIEEKDKCMTIAQTYIPDLVPLEAQKEGVLLAPKTMPVINLITIKAPAEKPAGKIIQLVIHFVELNKDYAKNFGFSWTPGIQDGSGIQFSSSNSSQGGVSSTITGTITNLLPRLNWAKTHGHARTLESTELLIQDGQRGVLNRTTDYPYPVIGANGVATTQVSKIGLQTSVTVKLLNPRSDNINMTFEFTMSTPAGTTNQGAPIVNANVVNTMINVRSGQSAAIAGLISNASETDYNRLPSSATNPIFTLLASKSFTHNQSQFVIFVTPIIKTSASQGSEKIKQKFKLRD